MWDIALIAVGAYLLAKPAVVSLKSLNVPAKAKKYIKHFVEWSEKSKIPPDVLLAWAKNESDFSPMEYNPEKSALAKWACEVANDPKWASNPDWPKAKKVCEMVSSGVTPEQIIEMDKGKPFNEKLWTFGSIGMFQSSRQAASGAKAVTHGTSNDELFDIQTNFKAGTAEINQIRKYFFSDKATLTDSEWAKIRTGYVMGPRGPGKNPAKAEEISNKFLKSLKEIRGA